MNKRFKKVVEYDDGELFNAFAIMLLTLLGTVLPSLFILFKYDDKKLYWIFILLPIVYGLVYMFFNWGRKVYFEEIK